MQARYGATRGAEVADRLFFRFLALVGPMDDAYQAMRAADVPDLGQQAAHACEIDAAFLGTDAGAARRFPDLTTLHRCTPGLISGTSPAIPRGGIPQ